MIEGKAVKEKGFLTAEVMMISLWLSALAAIGGIYIVGGKMVTAARNMTTACCLAERQMAYLKGDELLLRKMTINKSGEIEQFEPVSFVKNKTAFTVETLIKSVEEEKSLRRIVICVGWQESKARREFKLEDLVVLSDSE